MKNIPTLKKHLFLLAAIVIIDQVLKGLARAGSILFDTKFLAFNFVKNTGSAFGTLEGFSPYLIWLSFIFLGVLIYYYPESEEEERLPLALVMAGILGNLIDRVWLGYVVDFIDFKFWPVFNIADSSITIGILWLLYLEIKKL